MTTHTMKYKDETGAVIAVDYSDGNMSIREFNGTLVHEPVLRPCTLGKWIEGVARAMNNGVFVGYETSRI